MTLKDIKFYPVGLIPSTARGRETMQYLLEESKQYKNVWNQIKATRKKPT
jgi:hypothetical protein